MQENTRGYVSKSVLTVFSKDVDAENVHSKQNHRNCNANHQKLMLVTF